MDKRSSLASIRAIAAENPEAFVAAALALLESKSDVADQHRLCLGLMESEFLLLLIHSRQFDHRRLLEVCRGLKQIDDFLDVRLARLAPGRHENAPNLAPEVVLRLLDILHAISTGPRLIQILGHLTRHPDERVSSKAAMLVGHRLRNHNWVSVQLESPDPRMRANVVEGLWGVDALFARKCMREALNDENNRVAGNALLGLHLLHEPDTAQRLEQMLGDARPKFRRTAAWLMGKIGQPEFKNHLLRAASDEDPGVRQTATRALATFPTPEPTKEAESAPVSTPPVVPSVSAPAAPPPEDEKPVEAPADRSFTAPSLDGRSTRCR